MASCAALTANVLGIIRRLLANSAIANCSRELKVVAKFSKYIDKAASTDPPPEIGRKHKFTLVLNNNSYVNDEIRNI